MLIVARSRTRPAVRAALAVAVVAVVAVVAFGALRLIDRGDDADPGPSTPSSAASTGTSTGSSAPAAVPVFGPPPDAATGQSPDTSLGEVTRSRYVSFDGSVLPATPDGTELALDFFDDASFVVRVEHVDRQQVFTSWSGPVVGLEKSIFVITQTGDRYQVTASTTQGSFTMNLTASGLYQVAQVEQPAVLDEGGALPTSATP